MIEFMVWGLAAVVAVLVLILVLAAAVLSLAAKNSGSPFK